MVELLIDRRLIRRADDPVSARLPMTPELAMVVAARQLPAVVAVCTLENGSADKAPQMYGLAEAGRPPQVMVSEVVFPAKHAAFGPLHHFSLVSPERAGRILALWAVAHDKTGFLRPKSRIVDVYRNRLGEALTRDRIIVGGSIGAVDVTRQRPGGGLEPALRCSTDELAVVVTAILEEPTVA
jgi:hypothetical protein